MKDTLTYGKYSCFFVILSSVLYYIITSYCYSRWPKLQLV